MLVRQGRKRRRLLDSDVDNPAVEDLPNVLSSSSDIEVVDNEEGRRIRGKNSTITKGVGKDIRVRTGASG